jgi:hypothetical protein
LQGLSSVAHALDWNDSGFDLRSFLSANDEDALRYSCKIVAQSGPRFQRPANVAA